MVFEWHAPSNIRPYQHRVRMLKSWPNRAVEDVENTKPPACMYQCLRGWLCGFAYDKAHPILISLQRKGLWGTPPHAEGYRLLNQEKTHCLSLYQKDSGKLCRKRVNAHYLRLTLPR
jgi:hypothetical protein